MRYYLFCLLLCFSLTSYATIYEETDKNGDITFTDVPTGSAAKKVDIANGNVTQLPAPTPPPDITNNPATATSAKAGATGAYSTFLITSPTDQFTFQNQRDIPVEVKLDPELKKGDTIRLFVDGAPVGSPFNNTHLSIKQLDRGTHKIYAVLLDENQSQLKQSNAVTIYVHYASVQ
jgi:hypothetical protein